MYTVVSKWTKRSFVSKVVIFFFLLSIFYLLWHWNSHEQSSKWKFFLSIPRNLSSKPVVSSETCSCNRTLPESFLVAEGDVSTCDDYATARGYRQRVISFSLYKADGNLDFFPGIQSNLQKIMNIYPDWLVRVYYSLDTEDQNTLNALCELWCQFPFLDLCQVGRLPPPLGDQSQINGMIWRFFPLGDPLVERFIVRDLDSVISQREKVVVSEWIKSNATWHFMHDHPLHLAPILGGMWGGWNRNLTLTSNLRRSLVKNGQLYDKGSDQYLLKKYLQPIAQQGDDYIDHSSYFCGEYFKNSRPFPIRRKSDSDYVGSIDIPELAISLSEPCPERCRPPTHLDWVYC